MPDFLLELFSEEIPARMQVQAAADLERLIGDALRTGQLPFAATRAYAGPRRLALVVEGMQSRQPDRSVETRGPRLGAPPQALEGFLRGAGLASIDQCEVRDTGKGEFYFAVKQVPGKDVAELLAEIVPAALDAFPWPKSMRWGGNRQRWVRPLHHILAILYGDGETRVAPINWSLGETEVTAGNESKGHRFLAPAAFPVRDFAEYRAQLREHYVILDFEERRQDILAQARALCAAKGLRLKEDDALSREVAGLVEWPVALIGTIDPAFMDLPPEVLTTSMRSHQKYFACETADGTLAPFFIVVANNVTADGGAQIVAGNERVLRARLSDAKFFWKLDREQNLVDRLPKLEERVFHAELGPVTTKVWRLKLLARTLAQDLNADDTACVTAASLAKADLSSGLVGEFPELQGIVGSYIALSENSEATVIAKAIREHYLPAGPKDEVPRALVSVVIALADRIDTLARFFAIDEKPTGSKDPYALRRAALGIIRIVLENKLRIRLGQYFGQILTILANPPADVPISDFGLKILRHEEITPILKSLMEFIADRLKVALRDQGVRHDLIAAVFALEHQDDLYALVARVRALQDFLSTDDGANLLAAYRRAARIIEIEEKKAGAKINGAIEKSTLDLPEEKTLDEKLEQVFGKVGGALSYEAYADAMTALAELRGPVDEFFARVTVNVDDAALRNNRLNLLAQIRNLFNKVADFSKIEG